jgi:lipase
VRLHEHAWGREGAPQVVCVHGVGAHALRFRRLAEERLAGRFRVRALDLRGHGHSSWDPPWTLEAHLGDLVESADGPAVWIGHSFGGRLVVELLARNPGLVRAAVLLDPALWVPPEVANGLAREELEERSFAAPAEAVAARLGEGGFGWLAHTPPETIEQEVRDHLTESPDGRFRYRYSREAVAAAYHEMAALPPPFAALRVPTLLVVPSHGKLVSAGELELYRAALGDLFAVAVVPGGHMVLWDAFDETSGAIGRFLDAV